MSCYDALYRVIGERAGTLTTDAFVVRAYESSRSFGELALEMRSFVGDELLTPPPVLEAVLAHSIDHDDTGAMVLYAVSMVVGPRLLVTLLDARAATEGHDELRTLLNHGSQVTVAVIRSIGDTVQHRSAIDNPSWRAAARDLTVTLDEAGYAESLGIAR
jgi:hypothetical protein